MKRLSIGPRFYNAANRTRTPNGCEHAPMPDVLMGAKLLSRRCPSNLDAIGWNRIRKPPRILVRQRISFRCFDRLRVLCENGYADQAVPSHSKPIKLRLRAEHNPALTHKTSGRTKSYARSKKK